MKHFLIFDIFCGLYWNP